ncbi:MAG: hypothetical protein QOF43_411 [Gaiellaceae bacterium]|nr:hypothetical protein [Gaiellaceae bacterium]
MATALRLTAIAAVAFIAGSSGQASAHPTGIGFSFLPRHTVQGEDARVAVTVRPAGARCFLSIRYQGGTPQTGLAAAVATGGRASWTWRVPTDVQAGVAQATVRCAGAGAVTRKLLIVGRLETPKVTVAKQGFSIRPNPIQGARLSYGLILHNGAVSKDAVNVSVQVNFVMADHHLLGTNSQRIDAIPAGTDFALGNSVSFPAEAPIVQLEVVVQVEKFVAPSSHTATLENMHLLPALFDSRWLGTIEGELQNTDLLLTLRSAQLSAVVFDATGNIIGGGSGFAFQTLPPGTRQFVQLGSGFDAIPMDRASTATISITSSWQQPGS